MKTASKESIAAKFGQDVLYLPKLQHGAVRIGLWMAAVADLHGTNSVELFQSEIIIGYNGSGQEVPGVAFHPDTVRKSLASLEEAGLITSTKGARSKGGYVATVYTFQ